MAKNPSSGKRDPKPFPGGVKAEMDQRKKAWKRGGVTGYAFTPPLGGLDGSGDLSKYAPNVLLLPVSPPWGNQNRRSKA